MSLSKPHRVCLGGLWATASVLVVSSFALPHSRLLTALGDSGQCVLLFGFVLSAALNVWTTERRVRIFWTLVFLSATLWAITQVLWTYFEVFVRRDVPNLFIGDIVLFLHLVPLMGAVAIRPDVDPRSKNSRLGSLDFILLFVWWLYLFLFVVIPWQYVAPDDKIYGLSFDTLYLVEHVVLLIVVGIAWRNSRNHWRRIYGQLFAAALLYAISSVGASIAIDYGAYYTGSLYDLPLLVSMVLFSRSALLNRTSGAAESSRAENKGQNWIAWLAMAVAATLPMLAVWAVFFSKAPPAVRSFRFLLTMASIIVIGGLRSWKQYALDDELDRANQELREASLTDVLTGVRNRRFLANTIDNDVQVVVRAYSGAEKGRRNPNCDLIFYLIDLDHFKFINDAFGHDQGDDLLVQIAGRISSAIRHSDVLIRWGGEEFLVVSRNTNRDEGETLANRILYAVGTEPFRLADGQGLRRTCSIGWPPSLGLRTTPRKFAVPKYCASPIGDCILRKTLAGTALLGCCQIIFA